VAPATPLAKMGWSGHPILAKGVIRPPPKGQKKNIKKKKKKKKKSFGLLRVALEVVQSPLKTQNFYFFGLLGGGRTTPLAMGVVQPIFFFFYFLF
jgi:hypothetical protein